MFKTILSTVAAAAVVGLLSVSSTMAEDAAKCFPVATLKLSFQVVFPQARQIMMDGDAAKVYLEAYNNFGNPTSYTGEALFMNILPNGTTMVVPLAHGQGCERMIVGPRLHKMIMAKIERGSV